jgi:hypothetical protein
VRELIHHALHRAGGLDYLVRMAGSEPRAFLALVGRTVPQEQKLEASLAGPVKIEVVTGWSEGPHQR